MKLASYYFGFLPMIVLSFLVTFTSCDSKNSHEVTPASLDGTWQLVGYQNVDGKLEQISDNIDENPIIAFKQGEYGGSTLHNAYTGSYTLLANQNLMLTTPVSTLTTETQWGVKFLESLTKATHYNIRDQSLLMVLKDSDVQMVFQKMK